MCVSDSGGRRTPPTSRCGAAVETDDDVVDFRGDGFPSLMTSGDESESLVFLDDVVDDDEDGTMAERALPDDDWEMARDGDRNCAENTRA